MAFEVRETSRLFLPCASGFKANCAAEGQAALRAFCNASFGVTVPDAAELQTFWGSDWTAAGGGSRIVFSNGDLDPWSYGGVPDDVAGGDADGPLACITILLPLVSQGSSQTATLYQEFQDIPDMRP